MVATVTAPRLPSIDVAPRVPVGEQLARWAIETFERSRDEVCLAWGFEAPARQLTADRIHFLDISQIANVERAQRAPANSLCYQVFLTAGVPPAYLDTIYLPLLSKLEGLGVYWYYLSPEPELYASQAFVDETFSAPDAASRLCSAAQFGENLIRVWLDLLPESQTVPLQYQPRVRECFRAHLQSEFDAIGKRFVGSVDGGKFEKGFQIVSGLLDSEDAIYLCHGGRLVLGFEGQTYAGGESELGTDLNAGIVHILGERVRARFVERIQQAFLRRWRRPEAAEQAIRALQWRAMRLLRELRLSGIRELYDAYVHSDVPLYYWGAESKRVNLWGYPT
jgi:hypothetical protein